MLNQQVYTSVRVNNDGLERHGQVGVFVGAGDEPGESAVKFEAETQGGEQVIETFKDEDLEAV